jgi:phosphate transport system protein
MEPFYTFHHELINLKKKLMLVSTMVEERVRTAASVISSRDEETIQKLILTDYEIDEMEVEIEEDCLKILALHQPVASDLRFIIAVIKINNEIERIADMAVSIAIRVQTISEDIEQCDIQDNTWVHEYNRMSEKVITMLRMSLDALVNRDSKLARKVFILDDDVDAILKESYDRARQMLRRDTSHPGCLINIYLLARHLERIGDRATNIAEEVIHLVEGTIVRCP